MLRFDRLPDWITPVRAVFMGSLLLSLIAVCTSPAINNDGMLYVEAARVFLNDGLSASRDIFSWPFLPILLACVSKLTGLSLEISGQLLNAFFLAGTFGLLVDFSRRKFPEAAWSICLTLLALPALNHYRDEILREYGCWFFFMLSFWLAVRWSEVPRWRTALSVQLALVVAALFRPEASAYFAALAFWQLSTAPKGVKWRRALAISGLPLAFLATLAALFIAGHLDPANRLSSEFARINFAHFNEKAQALSNVLVSYARNNAQYILFFGSISLIPLKFLKHLGIFIVPFAYLLYSAQRRAAFEQWAPFSWLFLVHLLVLSVFVLDLQFLAGRYVIVLHLLAAPLIGYSLWLIMQRFPRWRTAVVALAGLAMISNAVSLSPKKAQFVEAGVWLAAHAKESPKIYLESSAVTYYAGWQLLRIAPPKDRTKLADDVSQGKYDMLVLESAPNDPDIKLWLQANRLTEIKRFGHSGSIEIIIAEPSISVSHIN